MVELFLKIIYARRQGSWYLSYDNINDARRLKPIFAEMLDLEFAHPEIYQQFLQGNFTAILSNDCALEADKVIEITLNGESKHSCGTMGFSRNQNAVNKREINVHYRAAMRAKEYLDYKPNPYEHSELKPK